MFTLRRAHERGTTNLGWLDSRHSFSFGGYHDPAWMGFGPLRVINDDRVAPGAGFPAHPHRDMEILSFVLSGGLAHRDDSGASPEGGIIRAGDLQRMTAGRGVRHSEKNASTSEPVHFLQIWIEPSRTGLTPGYEQHSFPRAERLGTLRPLASPDGRDGSLTIHQDATVYAAALRPGDRVSHEPEAGRGVWVQLAEGAAIVNGHELGEGDGARITDAEAITIEGGSDDESEVLLFDLPLD